MPNPITPRYEYETLPFDQVVGILAFCAQEDAYVTEDPIVAELRRLQGHGFRWVRTDGGHAIFERCIHPIHPRKRHE